MIAHLDGKIEHLDRNRVIIEVGGIGYLVKVSAAVLARLPKVGDRVKLYTYQVVREDDISLYGFLNREEKALFALLISISGIGPKLALALLSGFPLEKLVSAIAQGEVALLSSISGIGRKTAERIVVELKEKISKDYAIIPSQIGAGMKGDQGIISDSIAALIALGYSPQEARNSIMKLNLEELNSVEAVLKQSLKSLL